MPLLIQPASPSQHRRPWTYVLMGVPGVALLLLAGSMAWGWFSPIYLDLGQGKGVRIERSPTPPIVPGGDYFAWTAACITLPVPGDSEGYFILMWVFA